MRDRIRLLFRALAEETGISHREAVVAAGALASLIVAVIVALVLLMAGCGARTVPPPRADVAGKGAATPRAARIAGAAVAMDPMPAYPRRWGFGLTITDDTTRFRYNIRALPDCRKPFSAWTDPDFLASIRASDGTFPVTLWRARSGVVTRVEVLRVPAVPCDGSRGSAFFQRTLSSEVFAAGDVAVLEFTPGLFIAEAAQPGAFIHPDASQIDNRSNDAVTRPTVYAQWFDDDTNPLR